MSIKNKAEKGPGVERGVSLPRDINGKLDIDALAPPDPLDSNILWGGLLVTMIGIIMLIIFKHVTDWVAN